MANRDFFAQHFAVLRYLHFGASFFASYPEVCFPFFCFLVCWSRLQWFVVRGYTIDEEDQEKDEGGRGEIAKGWSFGKWKMVERRSEWMSDVFKPFNAFSPFSLCFQINDTVKGIYA